MIEIDNVRLSWKDILDGSKAFIDGTSIPDAIQITKNVHYNYFTFNSAIYNTDGWCISMLYNGKCVLDD